MQCTSFLVHSTWRLIIPMAEVANWKHFYCIQVQMIFLRKEWKGLLLAQTCYDDLHVYERHWRELLTIQTRKLKIEKILQKYCFGHLSTFGSWYDTKSTKKRTDVRQWKPHNHKSEWEALWWFHVPWVVFSVSFVVCQGMDDEKEKLMK